MLSKLITRVDGALEARIVEVQTHIARGLPAFNVVGLPSASVKESKERVRSAIISSNFKFPEGRITVNLSPASIPKSGGRYDLSIALGILIASNQIKSQINLDNLEIYGELGLDGSLTALGGLFPAILHTKQQGSSAIIPQNCDNNLALITGVKIFTARHLLDVVNFLQNGVKLPLIKQKNTTKTQINQDFDEVKGQFLAKRALEIAATGGHNVLLSGTPGSGKTMLIERISTITPDLSLDEILELGAIYSLAGVNFDLTNKHKIVRSPHHSASNIAIIGGGANPKPGEVSLAHRGILFLDELPEFNKNVLEVLREPLESGKVHLSRAKTAVEYPANFQLIAAQNPCKCGYFGDGTDRCHCTSEQISKYQHKISGPLLDRIDIKLSVKPVKKADLLDDNIQAENSEIIKKRVIAAYNKQLVRQGKVNANLTTAQIKKYIKLTMEQKELLATAIDKLGLSARSFNKVLKVARTIADLDESDSVKTKHLTEALGFARF
jgi:magnesium chelatase family protein